MLHVADLYDLIAAADRRPRPPFRRRAQRRRRRAQQRVARRADRAVPRARRTRRSRSPRDPRTSAADVPYYVTDNCGGHGGNGLGAGRLGRHAPRRRVRVAARAPSHRSNPAGSRRCAGTAAPRRRPDPCPSSSSPARPASSAPRPRSSSPARASTSSASTTTCGATSSATTAAPRGGASGSSSSVRGYRHVAADIRDERAMDDVFAALRPRRSRSSSTPPRSRRTTGPRASRSPTSPSTPTARWSLLEMTRRHCPDAAFIFTSTNKVYGDTPNRLPLVERETRWEVDDGHPFSRARHRRDDEHRRDHAQRVRRVEGRGRRHGAGVRPLLRHEDRLLPRRLPDRARATPAPSCTASSPTS